MYSLSVIFIAYSKNIFQVLAQWFLTFLDDAHHRTVSDKDNMISLLHLQNSICLFVSTKTQCTAWT